MGAHRVSSRLAAAIVVAVTLGVPVVRAQAPPAPEEGLEAAYPERSLASASWTNTIGAPELIGVWIDVEMETQERAYTSPIWYTPPE